jgi:hypothetical protein
VTGSSAAANYLSSRSTPNRHKRLGAPIKRVTAAHTPVAISRPLEQYYVPMADARLLDFGVAVMLRAGPCTAGADCEREIEIQDLHTQNSVRLDPRGARVIDVNPALAAGAFVTARHH